MFTDRAWDRPAIACVMAASEAGASLLRQPVTLRVQPGERPPATVTAAPAQAQVDTDPIRSLDRQFAEATIRFLGEHLYRFNY
jgi:hypothetical protein